jgi:hypothetical protein
MALDNIAVTTEQQKLPKQEIRKAGELNSMNIKHFFPMKYLRCVNKHAIQVEKLVEAYITDEGSIP